MSKFTLSCYRKEEKIKFSLSVFRTLKIRTLYNRNLKIIISQKGDYIKVYRARSEDFTQGVYYFADTNGYVSSRDLLHAIFFHFDKGHSNKLVFTGTEKRAKNNNRHYIEFKLKEAK